MGGGNGWVERGHQAEEKKSPRKISSETEDAGTLRQPGAVALCTIGPREERHRSYAEAEKGWGEGNELGGDSG